MSSLNLFPTVEMIMLLQRIPSFASVQVLVEQILLFPIASYFQKKQCMIRKQLET